MRNPMTIDEHGRASARLIRAEGELRQLLELIQDRVGVRARVLDRCLRIHEHIDLVRAELESVLFKNHPAADATVYYPQTSNDLSEVAAGGWPGCIVPAGVGVKKTR
jgi:hypothetical protein